jgi:hypothetical protein|tara:strand:+ start:676 stop:939 length:264 start_codon:yes stop_codon:yes gene_type:complete
MEEIHIEENNILSKQSIRKNVKIYINQTQGKQDYKLVKNKETVIKESHSWTEQELNFFKKMLKQGGKFSVGGRRYHIIPAFDNRSLV